MGYIALGDLISKAQVEKCGKREYPVLSMTMHDGIVFQNDRFKKDIASIDRSNYSVVGFNQLVVSFPIDEGVLAVQDITDAGIVSPAYKIWDIDQAKLVPKYLEMWLRSPRSIDYYKSKLRGTTARRRSIPEEDFLGMRVNVPTIEEQKRIVDIITRVKGVVLLREQQLSALDDLIKARFVEMLKNERTTPRKLKDIVEQDRIITYGMVKPGKDVPGGVIIIKVKDFPNGIVETGEFLHADPSLEAKYERSRVKEGDLLYSIRGTVGRTAFVTKELVGANITQDTARLSIARDRYNANYIRYALGYDDVVRQIESQIKGVAMKGISLSELREIEIPCVKYDSQQEFGAFVEQVDKSKVAVQKALDEAQVLFDCLMQKYFG